MLLLARYARSAAIISTGEKNSTFWLVENMGLLGYQKDNYDTLILKLR